MALGKPLKRTVRQLTNGSYKKDGHWLYLLHPEFANEPQHYIRAFLLIQDDLQKLFEYVEPCDENSNTISLRIQELLTRVCIEIEANFTAILKENKYSNTNNIRRPFENWAAKPNANWHVLNWYQAYNKSKHDRHLHFDKATFDTLLNAISGLVVLLSSQFMDESYFHNSKVIGLGGNYSYDYNALMETAIGGYFMVQFPNDWNEEEQYEFKWQNISSLVNPIDKIDFDIIRENNFV